MTSSASRKNKRLSCVKKRAIRESLLRKTIKFCGREWRPRHPEKTNAYRAQNTRAAILRLVFSILLRNISVCHPELVELPRVEPWRTSGSASHKAKRDLAQNFGGFLSRCNIHNKSHPNSLRDPIVADAPRFCLFASLNPQNFDYENRSRFSPLRMTG